MATITKYVGKKGTSYNITVSCGYDNSGRQINKRMTWHPDPDMTEAQIKKELEKQVTKFENACRTGQAASSVKFEELAEQWLEEVVKPGLKTSTYSRLLQLRDRVYPAIGHMKIDKITRRDIRNLINDIALNAKNKKDSSKGLSYKTVKHYLSFISDVFRHAIECDLVSNNPCEYVKIPRTETNGQKPRDCYTIEELCTLYDLMEEQNAPLKYQVFFNIAFFAGFRRGEVLGLEWKDIDWEQKSITVWRTSNYDPKRGIYTSSTKTKSSQRVGCYTDKLFELLRNYKDEQDQEKKKLGRRWIENDRLFTKWDGSPMFPTTPYCWLEDFCEDNDFRFCNVHSFRHSHASGLIAAGLDVPKVAADLGHSNNLTTMQIYAHEFQLAQAKPKDVLEQGIEAARERLEADKKALPEKVTAQKVKVAIKRRKKP